METGLSAATWAVLLLPMPAVLLCAWLGFLFRRRREDP